MKRIEVASNTVHMKLCEEIRLFHKVYTMWNTPTRIGPVKCTFLPCALKNCRSRLKRFPIRGCYHSVVVGYRENELNQDGSPIRDFLGYCLTSALNRIPLVKANMEIELVVVVL